MKNLFKDASWYHGVLIILALIALGACGGTNEVTEELNEEGSFRYFGFMAYVGGWLLFLATVAISSSIIWKDWIGTLIHNAQTDEDINIHEYTDRHSESFYTDDTDNYDELTAGFFLGLRTLLVLAIGWIAWWLGYLIWPIVVLLIVFGGFGLFIGYHQQQAKRD